MPTGARIDLLWRVLPAAHDDHISYSFDIGYRRSQGLETKWI